MFNYSCSCHIELAETPFKHPQEVLRQATIDRIYYYYYTTGLSVSLRPLIIIRDGLVRRISINSILPYVSNSKRYNSYTSSISGLGDVNVFFGSQETWSAGIKPTILNAGLLRF